jgi:hypothetical protein
MTSEPHPDRDLDRVAGLVALVGVAAAIAAAAAVWLVVTEPVTVADAVDAREILPLVHRLAVVIYDAMAGLLDFL